MIDYKELIEALKEKQTEISKYIADIEKKLAEEEQKFRSTRNQEEEKERIIKALEDEKAECVKQKKRASIFDSYLKAASYEIAMDNAIEIVKRGGKE